MFLCNTYVFLKEDDLRLIHKKTATVIADPQTAPPTAAPMIAPAGVALMTFFYSKRAFSHLVMNMKWNLMQNDSLGYVHYKK